MDAILNSNKDSTLLNTLWQSELSQPYKFKILTNFSNGSRTFTRVYPLAGKTASTPTTTQIEIQFIIPKVMLAEDMIHRIVAKVGAGTETGLVCGATGELGLFIFSSQRLTAHGKTICQTDPYYNQVCAKNDSFAGSAVVSKLSNGYNPANLATATLTTGQSIECLAPFYNTFSTKTCMYLDTQYLEPLQLNCIVESTQNLNLSTSAPAANPFESVDFELWVFFRCLDTETLNAVRATNYAPNLLSSWLFSDSYTESLQAIGNGATTIDVTLRNKFVANATSFMLINQLTTPTAASYPNKRAISATTSGIITSFNFVASGLTIFPNVPITVLEYDTGRRYGKSNIQCSNAGAMTCLSPAYGPHTIYWGESNDESCNTHAFAYYSAGQPLLTLNFSATSAATFWAVVTHRIFGFLNIDPMNGAVEVVRNS